ncbi:hypothetical protein CEE44_03235 [Candidatus Woesearchaeota archaeon B3_Woes]|nr:MAG: hypothetical protein CEE44_03235 [Candidatus Woesearchaeota archaeon B3_Woes]
MNILGICGSPRKGNTEFMLNSVLDFAKERGVETELLLLKGLKIENCTGCDICFNEGKPCYIKDDFSNVLDKMLDSDAIVFGSPNYFKNVSGLMKTFMDRTNEIVKDSKLGGKNAAFVCVGGQSIDNTMFCGDIFSEFIKEHKMNLIGSVIAKAEAPNDLQKNDMVVDECKKLGEKLAGN